MTTTSNAIHTVSTRARGASPRTHYFLEWREVLPPPENFSPPTELRYEFWDEEVASEAASILLPLLSTAGWQAQFEEEISLLLVNIALKAADRPTITVAPGAPSPYSHARSPSGQRDSAAKFVEELTRLLIQGEKLEDAMGAAWTEAQKMM